MSLSLKVEGGAFSNQSSEWNELIVCYTHKIIAKLHPVVYSRNLITAGTWHHYLALPPPSSYDISLTVHTLADRSTLIRFLGSVLHAVVTHFSHQFTSALLCEVFYTHHKTVVRGICSHCLFLSDRTPPTCLPPKSQRDKQGLQQDRGGTRERVLSFLLSRRLVISRCASEGDDNHCQEHHPII
jgi:hypothetical protein